MGDDYRYTIDIEAKRKFLELLKERFNSDVKYEGKMWRWDTIILAKALELARFILGKSTFVNFIEPSPIFKRSDSLEMRRRILELTQEQAQKRGINKSTLHYLRKNARNERSFTMYGKIAQKINS